MVLVGVENGDTQSDASWLAAKTAGLRIFADEAGVMNLDVKATEGDVMGVFGADMQIELTNDGPVTIIIDSKLKE